MNKFMQGILFTLLIVYVISPLDLAPGPIDDAIALLLYAAANRKQFGLGKKQAEIPELIDVERSES